MSWAGARAAATAAWFSRDSRAIRAHCSGDTATTAVSSTRRRWTPWRWSRKRSAPTRSIASMRRPASCTWRTSQRLCDISMMRRTFSASSSDWRLGSFRGWSWLPKSAHPAITAACWSSGAAACTRQNILPALRGWPVIAARTSTTTPRPPPSNDGTVGALR